MKKHVHTTFILVQPRVNVLHNYTKKATYIWQAQLKQITNAAMIGSVHERGITYGINQFVQYLNTVAWKQPFKLPVVCLPVYRGIAAGAEPTNLQNRANQASRPSCWYCTDKQQTNYPTDKDPTKQPPMCHFVQVFLYMTTAISLYDQSPVHDNHARINKLQSTNSELNSKVNDNNQAVICS